MSKEGINSAISESTAEESAFEQFIKLHESRLYALNYYLLGDRREAEELLGEQLLRIWQMGLDNSFESVNLTSAYRVALACIEDQFKLRQYWTSSANLRQANSSMESGRKESKLYNAVEMLPFEYRKMFVLHDIIGISITEIVKIGEISEICCRARLQRARRMIRRLMNKDQYFSSMPSTSTGAKIASHQANLQRH